MSASKNTATRTTVLYSTVNATACAQMAALDHTPKIVSLVESTLNTTIPHSKTTVSAQQAILENAVMYSRENATATV